MLFGRGGVPDTYLSQPLSPKTRKSENPKVRYFRVWQGYVATPALPSKRQEPLHGETLTNPQILKSKSPEMQLGLALPAYVPVYPYKLC